MLGDVALDHGGTVEFGGNKYTLERGNLTFSNPFRNDPSLDLVASTTVREFNVRLNVYGPVDALETSFSSTPPLPSLDVVSLLTTRSTDTLSSLGGRTTLESRGDGNTAETFLASQAASLAGQRVGDLFGLDQVQITPLTGASSELSTARLTVGKRISRDLYVTYSYDPSESGEEIVEVAWQMYPTIVVLLRATDQGSYTADIRWTKSF
jgi:translocation and assembly module TamB